MSPYVVDNEELQILFNSNLPRELLTDGKVLSQWIQLSVYGVDVSDDYPYIGVTCNTIAGTD